MALQPRQSQIVTPPPTPVWAPNPGPQTFALSRTEKEMLYGGARGGGKLQSLHSPVLTPFGWVTMGDLKVGDQVTDPTTGGASTVIAVHPHDSKTIYRITFDDGASCEVGLEHLWAFKRPNHLRPGTKHSSQREFAREVLGRPALQDRWHRYRVGDTQTLIDLLAEGEEARIPLTEPVLFSKNGRTGDGQVDPYIAGALLGDGHIESLGITCCDDEIRDYLLANGFSGLADLHTDGRSKTWSPQGDTRIALRAWTQNHGLAKHRSWEKFIPDYVFTAPIDYRLAFLQGLMDTDGTVDERGRCYFTSTSERLADGLRQLVWSLGGKAYKRTNHPTFTYLGEKKDGRPAYTCLVQLAQSSAFFRLSRKIARCTNSWNGGHEMMRAVRSIEKLDDQPAKCITVSSPHGLYVTNDYIVTHNSVAGMVFSLRPAIERTKGGTAAFPGYRGLVLRLQADDLNDWVDRAETLYSKFGAKRVGRPARFEFPGGPTIYTNHLQSKDAYKKYQGHEYQRINFEELTQIPEELWYDMVLGSCRSTIPGLFPQIFSSANPGGPGHAWVRSRFIDVLDQNGNKIPPGTPFFVYANTARGRHTNPPEKNLQELGHWRIFVPASVDDTPQILENDPGYVAYLDSLPGNLKKAWRHGDWDAFAGQFFQEFRPYGPMTGDPTWANHVIPAGHEEARLEPWWPRWGALDWGHDHPMCMLWGCENQNTGRTHVYREYHARRLSAAEIGFEVARKTAEDFSRMPNPSLVVYVDPSCYQKRDGGKLIPEQMMDGIVKALGMGSARLVQLDGSLTDNEGKRLDSDLEYKPSSRPMITLKPASNARIAGWQTIREGLRFNPLYVGGERDEVLPKLYIHANCTKLITCLSTLVHDEDDLEDVLKVDARDGVGGDDPGDALRYLMMSRKGVRGVEPIQSFIGGRVRQAMERNGGMLDPTAYYQIAEKAERDWRESHGAGSKGVVIDRGMGAMGRSLHAKMRRAHGDWSGWKM